VHLLRAAVLVDAGEDNAPPCRIETTVRERTSGRIIRIHGR
jgi:hypothetical protein